MDRRDSLENLRLRGLEREAELGAAGGVHPCIHIHHHHHHHRGSPSLNSWRGRSFAGAPFPRQPIAVRRDSSSSLESTFRNPRQAPGNSPPGSPSSPCSVPLSQPPSYESLGFPACDQAVDDPELGDLVVRSCVLSTNYLPPSRREPEDILEDAAHIFGGSSLIWEVDSVSVDVPAASDSGESFRSESSRLPEQVNSVRADLSLLIRSEIYDIIADGYRNSSDIFDELTSRFLDETCEDIQEFRALFRFAFRCPIEEGFPRVCEEARR